MVFLTGPASAGFGRKLPTYANCADAPASRWTRFASTVRSTVRGQLFGLVTPGWAPHIRPHITSVGILRRVRISCTGGCIGIWPQRHDQLERRTISAHIPGGCSVAGPAAPGEHPDATPPVRYTDDQGVARCGESPLVYSSHEIPILAASTSRPATRKYLCGSSELPFVCLRV
jgi:hypothetical protein